MTTATGTTLQDATHLHLINDPLRYVKTSQGAPMSYRHGEVDEQAWLKHGVVVGKGER